MNLLYWKFSWPFLRLDYSGKWHSHVFLHEINPNIVVVISSFVMPPPLGAGGIMFSGCPSVPPSIRPSVRSLKYPLLTCTWVRWCTRPTVTVLRHVRLSVRPSVRLSVRPSVRPSVRRGFRAFAGECMEGLAWNFTCWCILTIFRTD